jgi:two-component system OmpR family response regulator
MTAPDHILIVDDDREIRTLLGDYLGKNGFRATAVADGKGMWNALDAGRVDLVVLPGDDSTVLCRVCGRGATCLSMLTAKGEDTDRIVGRSSVRMTICQTVQPAQIARAHQVGPAQASHRARPSPAGTCAGLRFAGWTLDLAARNLNLAAGRGGSVRCEFACCRFSCHLICAVAISSWTSRWAEAD